MVFKGERELYYLFGHLECNSFKTVHITENKTPLMKYTLVVHVNEQHYGYVPTCMSHLLQRVDVSFVNVIDNY